MPMPAPVPPSHCVPALALDHFRKLAGVTLDEIAANTKISVRFLRAIEAGEYDKLPGGIFTTSYLRQYAAAIGYDESALLDHYQRKMNPQSAAANDSSPDNRTRLDRWFRMALPVSR